MCVVSMISDHYTQKWQGQWQQTNGQQNPGLQPSQAMPGSIAFSLAAPSRIEFDELKREVLEMKELLKRAKAYDEKTGQPDCGLEQKMEILRKVAQAVGVDLDDVMGAKK